MEYVYQIKIVTGEYNSFHRPVLAQGIIEKDCKKDVVTFLAEEYPEYFDGNKVSQKLSKSSQQVVYVTIHELDDYWSKYWKQEIECEICHKKVPLIEIKNHVGRLSNFLCSVTCEEQQKKKAENELNEYWNERCPYYFIYKITNKKNGKVYIGYTEREPIFRWWEHFKHSNLPIGLALKEYGIENFLFEVLEKYRKDEKTIDDMHSIETNYISKYNSIKDGYNCINSKKQDFEYCTELVED